MQTLAAKKKKKKEKEEEEEEEEEGKGGRKGEKKGKGKESGRDREKENTIKHILLLLSIRSLITSIISVVSGVPPCLQQTSNRELFKKTVCTGTQPNTAN